MTLCRRKIHADMSSRVALLSGFRTVLLSDLLKMGNGQLSFSFPYLYSLLITLMSILSHTV